jgi:hypothetical protein
MRKPFAWERLKRAEQGELAFFWSYYCGSAVFKVLCADIEKLKKWTAENGLPEDTVLVPESAMPSVTLVGKSAKEAIRKVAGRTGYENRQQGNDQGGR